jgi:hypothetical protein
MPQMDVDIRKPVSHDFGFRRKGSSERSLAGSTSDDDDDDDDDLDSDDEEDQPQSSQGSPQQAAAAGASKVARQPEGLVSFEDIEREAAAAAAAGDDGAEDAQVETQPLSDGQVVYESDDDEEDGSGRRSDAAASASSLDGFRGAIARCRRAVASTARALVPSTQMGSTIPRSERLTTLFGRDDEIVTKHFRAPRGKKIHVPVRIEPKVYFANERTFLGWVSCPRSPAGAA